MFGTYRKSLNLAIIQRKTSLTFVHIASVTVINTWNNLPEHVIMAPSLNTFKKSRLNVYWRRHTHKFYPACCEWYNHRAEKPYEPHHDKTSQMECAPSEDSDQPGHPPSLIRVFAVRLKKARILSYPLSARRRLIRMGGCQGWSESSLGTHAISLVLSRCGSYSKCVYTSQMTFYDVDYVSKLTSS